MFSKVFRLFAIHVEARSNLRHFANQVRMKKKGDFGGFQSPEVMKKIIRFIYLVFIV